MWGPGVKSSLAGGLIRAYEAGAMLYLPKPFTNVALLETVSRALR